MRRYIAKAARFAFSNISALFSSISEAAFFALAVVNLSEEELNESSQLAIAIKVALIPVSLIVAISQFNFFRTLNERFVDHLEYLYRSVTRGAHLRTVLNSGTLKKSLMLPNVLLEIFTNSASVYLLIKNYEENAAQPFFILSLICSAFSSYSLLFLHGGGELHEAHEEDLATLSASNLCLIGYVEHSFSITYGTFYFFNSLSLLESLNEKNVISRGTQGAGQFTLVLMALPIFINLKNFTKQMMVEMSSRARDFNFWELSRGRKLLFVASLGNLLAMFPLFTIDFYRAFYSLVSNEGDFAMTPTAEKWLAGVMTAVTCPGLLIGFAALLLKEQLRATSLVRSWRHMSSPRSYADIPFPSEIVLQRSTSEPFLPEPPDYSI